MSSIFSLRISPGTILFLNQFLSFHQRQPKNPLRIYFRVTDHVLFADPHAVGKGPGNIYDILRHIHPLKAGNPPWGEIGRVCFMKNAVQENDFHLVPQCLRVPFMEEQRYGDGYLPYIITPKKALIKSGHSNSQSAISRIFTPSCWYISCLVRVIIIFG